MKSSGAAVSRSFVQSARKYTWCKSTRLMKEEEVASKQPLTSTVLTLVPIFPTSSSPGTKTLWKCLQKFTFLNLRSRVSKLLAKEVQSSSTHKLWAVIISHLFLFRSKRSTIIDSAYNLPKGKKCPQAKKGTTQRIKMGIRTFSQLQRARKARIRKKRKIRENE